MKRTYKILGAIAIVTSLGITTAVYANAGGAGPCMGNGAMSGMNGMGGMAGQTMDHSKFDPAAMMDGRLATLKATLKITGEQEAAWQTFSAKAKQQAATMQASHTAMSSQNTGASAPDRMTQRMAMMQQHLGNMETMNGALKDLYAVLTPEQKAIADQSFGHMRMAFGGR